MRIAVIGGGPGGLYFALLAKKAFPGNDITVYERNAADDTFGSAWCFPTRHSTSFSFAIRKVMTRSPASSPIGTKSTSCCTAKPSVRQAMVSAAAAGWNCCRSSRALRRACVEMKFNHEITNLNDIDADLVIGADGINSIVRNAFPEKFQSDTQWRKKPFRLARHHAPL